jgi:hypothetical protein
MLFDQVVLSSSLEDPSFSMPGIKYFNTLAQVLFPSWKPAAVLLTSSPLHIVPYVFHCGCMLSLLNGQQTSDVSFR